jgi:PAS domain S-box-containing protein
MEEAAGAVVRRLREHFTVEDGSRSALALARLYVTRRLSELEPDVQDFARAAATDAFARHNAVCLTLLATAGDEEAWNDRHRSLGHKAIPLPSVEAIARLPMVARLVEQLGIDPRHVVAPDEVDPAGGPAGGQGVFFVPRARDSSYVPAQSDFVVPYGIRSVLGCGGLLPDGSLYAVILFSTVDIPPEAARAFPALSLGVQLALLPFVGGPTFQSPVPDPQESHVRPDQADPVLASKVAALEDLVARLAEGSVSELARSEGRAAVADRHEGQEELLRRQLDRSEALRAGLATGAPWCVVGMDHRGLITECNPAAERTFGFSADELIGRPLAETLIPPTLRQRHRDGLDRLLTTGDRGILDTRIEVHALHRDGSELPIELTIRQIDDHPPSFYGFARDLTAEHRSRDEGMASREHLAHIARTLQSSLLPPALPDVEGYDLSAVFRAMGAGFDVGGDFYDVFALERDRWMLTLGDVCGKGSDAAALTALARYTLRAAAMQDADPSTVLSVLNEAVHRHDPDRFCTVVCAVLDPPSGSVELSLGGHPPPLVARASGRVEPVGTPNPLLGPAPHWQGTVSRFTLESGDTLLLYSDGVTEARREGDLFGHDRLVGTVEANHSSPTLVEAVEAAIMDFAKGYLTDDVAVLALRRR